MKTLTKQLDCRFGVLALVSAAMVAGCGTGAPPLAVEPADPVPVAVDSGSEEAASADAGAFAAEPPTAPASVPPSSPETPDSGVEQLAPPPRSGPELTFHKGRGRCEKQEDCSPEDCCAPVTCVAKRLARKCKKHKCADILGGMTGAGAWCACHEGRCGAMYPEPHP